MQHVPVTSFPLCSVTHSVFLLLFHIMHPYYFAMGLAKDESNIYPEKREEVYNE
jgi:hypothetical protein